MSKPLSFSAVSSYNKCPKQYADVRLNKIYPYVQSPEAARGDAIHSALRAAISDGHALPEDMVHYQPLIDTLSETGMQTLCEAGFAINKDKSASLTSDKSRWWDDNVYFAGDIDLLLLSKDRSRAKIVDWKSNKTSRYADIDQLELYSLAVLLAFPACQRVDAALIFLEAGFEVLPQVYTRDCLPEVWGKWISRWDKVNKAIGSGSFPHAEYTPLCGWCPCTDCPNYERGQEYRRKRGA